ncbi:MAG: hypothetical protein M1365_05030 [Actinobacteria bacterium]|nr:hypothetical protein [Actinomycetota bacterium]
MKKTKNKKTENLSNKTPRAVQDLYINIVPGKILFLAIFIISAASLSFEIIITRISSILFTFNYAFILVSLAILGLGCGGIFAFYKLRTRETEILDNIYNILSLYGSLFALSVMFFIILVTSLSFFIYIIPFFIISFIPFFFAGFLLAIIFRAIPQDSFKIYAFDLLGAATGVIFVILALNKFSGVNIVLFISILGMIASFLFLKRENIRRGSLKIFTVAVGTALFSIALLITNLTFGFLGEIPTRNDPLKELSSALNDYNSEIIDSRWSTFGRTDLVKFLDDDKRMYLFIDGGAGTQMLKFDGNIENTYDNIGLLKDHMAGAFPFLLLKENEKNNMLIIGPGGGREVLLGLVNKVDNITAVEVNKDFVDIVKEYKDYNGGIYTDFKNVNVIVKEGRDFIRNTKNKFDIIMLTIPVTKSSRSIEGYALTENYLLTVESVKDYLNHLSEEGRMIVVLHNSAETMRFVTTSLEALESMGFDKKAAMERIYVVGEEMMPLVVLKKNPFTIEESKEIHDYMHGLGFDTAQTYIPHIGQQFQDVKHQDGTTMTHYMFNNSLVNLSKGKINTKDLVKSVYFNISPATDDRPFFFDNQPGIPNNLVSLLLFAALVNLSVILPPIKFRKAQKNFLKLMSLFLFLGAGFMMIEISFFQKLTFYLGSPTISLAVILTSLLTGMGVGSFASRRIYNGQNIKKLVLSGFLVFIIATGLFFAIPFIMNGFGQISILNKSILTSLLLIPLGFILGIPFPTGINLTKEMRFESSVPWLYGINGTMSVLGSVLALTISTILGFTASLILGTLCYLAIALIFKFGKQAD